MPSDRPRRKLVRRIAAGLSLLLLVLVGTAYGAYRYYDSKVTRIALPSLHKGTTVTTGSYFLLAGSDTRELSDGAQFQASGASAVTGQRADTVILVHIPTGSAKVTLMSFPRDSYVQIPAFTDKAGVTTAAHAAHYAKLNEAFAIGGADLLVKTIEGLSGLPVDHYLQINFDGFRRIVDAVGGVTLCVGTTRSDKDSGDFLTAGTHPNVSGAEALAFVRDRKGLASGDLDRIADQQYFVSQVLKKVLAAGTLANPVRLTSLLNATTESLTADKRFGLSQLRTLASRLSNLDSSHVTFVTLPVLDAEGRRVIHGLRSDVVLLDQARLPAAFAAVEGKLTPTTQPSSPQPPATQPPATAHSTAAPSPTSPSPTVKATTAKATTCAV